MGKPTTSAVDEEAEELLQARVPASLKERIRQFAKADDRSLASMVKKILERYVEEVDRGEVIKQRQAGKG